MNRGLRTDNPLVTGAFHHRLLDQFLVVLVCALLAIIVFNVLRSVQVRRALARPDGLRPEGAGAAGGSPPAGTATSSTPPAAPALGTGEPLARLVLRLVFGVLWTADGLLQLQRAMPLGLPSGVLSPAAQGAPGWVRSLVNVAVTVWSNHPITSASAAVWIQLGLGIGLLVAPRGWWSRGLGLASALWGAMVWVFAEALGGLLTPGASWLFGLPGAAIFYVVAGALLWLPESSWQGPSLGRRLLRAMGALFVAMGVLQAWPGRGSWQGQATPHAAPGLTTAMLRQMAATPQPSALHDAVASFASFDAAHGWAVNLVLVVALCGLGLALLVARGPVLAVAVWAAVALCAATWVLVQDFGVLGGVGTDPNSMVPTAALLVVGLLGVRRPAPAVSPARLDAHAPAGAPYLLRASAAACAAVVVLVGAAPMALAATNPQADPILSEAVNGSPNFTDIPSWNFRLVDQHGRTTSLSSFRGDVVVLTFLDPVCTTDCPLIAQELYSANRQLAGTSPKVQFVAVDANPTFRSVADLQAFDAQDRLQHVANWTYLTGSLGELTSVWVDYGADVSITAAGGMAAHGDLVYVLDPHGRIRTIVNADPGDTAATGRSLATVVVDQVHRVQSL